jgi:endonuclease YncB( thermonuclease family)
VMSWGLWLLLMLLVPGLAHAQEPCLVEVIDGDTIHTCEGRIRLRTCNAPEPWLPGGRAARSTLQTLIDAADNIELVCHREECRDIFKRPLCDLVLDGIDACHTLMVEGHAMRQRRMRPCSREMPTERSILSK